MRLAVVLLWGHEIVFLRVFQGLVVVDIAGFTQILMEPWKAGALYRSDPFGGPLE